MSDFCTDVFIPSNLTKASLNLGSSKVVTGCRNCNHNQKFTNHYIPAHLVSPAMMLLVSHLDPTLSVLILFGQMKQCKCAHKPVKYIYTSCKHVIACIRSKLLSSHNQEITQ